jgi:hypothetical protein
MTKHYKTGLLATVSAAALCVIAASPAAAFDRVNWTWDAEVREVVNKNIDITALIEPTGMVMVEDLQVYIGDVSSTSTVSDINNYQPSEGGVGGPGDTVNFDFTYDDVGNGTKGLDEDFVGNVVSLTVDENADRISGTLSLDGVQISGSQAYDALTELPEVISAATAVANNTSITSDTMVELHEGQFAFNVQDDGNGNGEGPPVRFETDAETDNSNLTAAGVLGVLAISGDLVPSQISANSTVSEILNATVDSSATAVANNISISMEPKSPGDSVLLADIVQFAYADVTATSSVSNVSLNNYTNLGLLDRPIISSVATAVGNNKSISVSAPTVVSP